VDSVELQVDTCRTQLADLTDETQAFCRERGDGVPSVFVPHATAGMALMEMGSG
jgi:thiamine phosphate synthase YjbQ (UPF0047 family)